MAWANTPNDPLHIYKGYEICLYVTLDDGGGDQTIMLMYRLAGIGAAWQGGGVLWHGQEQDWTTDMANKGGFSAWMAGIIAKVNAQIMALGTQLWPVAAPAGTDPNTWAQLQAWVGANIAWVDTSAGPQIVRK